MYLSESTLDTHTTEHCSQRSTGNGSQRPEATIEARRQNEKINRPAMPPYLSSCQGYVLRFASRLVCV